VQQVREVIVADKHPPQVALLVRSQGQLVGEGHERGLVGGGDAAQHAEQGHGPVEHARVEEAEAQLDCGRGADR
jgi:hypothetical protein